MKWKGRRKSSHIEDRRGRSGDRIPISGKTGRLGIGELLITMGISMGACDTFSTQNP